MTDLRTIQHELGAWSVRTFPNATHHGILKHLEHELAELAGSFTDKQPDPIEAADIAILLFGLCYRMHWDLDALIAQKFAINLMRDWHGEDPHGVYRHIESTQGETR